MLDCGNVYAPKALDMFLKPDTGHFQNNVAQFRYSLISMHNNFKNTLGHKRTFRCIL